MANFKFVQCVNPDCNLRMPIDLDRYSGKFCPRCSVAMQIVADFQPYRSSDEVIEKPKRPLVVILDNIRSAYNVGAIFRTADGVGVNKLYLCGITPNPENMPSITKTALGAEINLPWEYHPNGLTTAKTLRDHGDYLAALEMTASSVSLMSYRPKKLNGGSFVLIMGNEKVGVDPGMIELCDVVLSLPMVGKKASLNVAAAFAAAAYRLSFI